MSQVTDVIRLLGELNNLKRVRVAGNSYSLAEQYFAKAWGAIVSGEDVREVALRISAHFVASSRLGGITGEVMAGAGLNSGEVTETLVRSLREASSGLDLSLRGDLQQQLAFALAEQPVPDFVGLLCNQPRAGATRPGEARILLLPAESHGDHCLTVAVYGVLLAPKFGAAIEMPFLAGLAHHLHNAYLPDSGFAGEEMLGSLLERVMVVFRLRAAEQLEPTLRDRVFRALDTTGSAETAEGKAFHAADVIDRVLQMQWYESAARFELRMAMEDMQLVHAGPVQQFHRTVLREAGLW